MAEGLGDMKNIVAEWEKLKVAFDSAQVWQDEFLGAPASMRVGEDGLRIEFGG